MMPISHILRSIEAVSTIRCSQPSSLPAAAPGDTGGTVAAAAAMDQAHVVLQKIASMTNDVTRAFESVRELNVMHMYTAADNMRLVFNSRYVVDLRLVSSDLFHITDAVGAIRRGKGNSPKGRNDAPEPLVTPATEPIPLFADWLDAMARGMRFDWEKLEKFVSAIFSSEGGSSDYLEDGGGGDDDSHDSNRVRLFQRNLHRLRPGASKVEQYLYRFREMTSKQNSARAPTFVVLPPAAILCTRLHLVSVLRSLMHWLVQSVHVRDLLESAIARTLELVDQQRQQGLFCVKEKLVYTEEIASAPSTSGGGKQVMIVGFTGARDSVRCEFLMQAGVTNAKEEKEEEEEEKAEEEDVEKEEAEKDIDGLALLSDLYSVPSTLMRVDLDVRIVPLNRPPNGITDAAAALLIKAFKRQTTDIRQRAGVLVRILALPPQLVMDIVDIAKRLPTKADVCAITRGLEHLVRIDALNAKVSFTMRFDLDNNAAGTAWSSDIVIEYELVEGVASVVEGTDVWRARVAAAVAALDQQTAFTRDMGKSGKSRWFDIINKLCETTE
ncbi:hypothetical protein GGF42_001947 [Coemansia sp. RSA 2424]|nr:hypothetical protein GGF42_001947 [Coemansia sp. RSA 2424]